MKNLKQRTLRGGVAKIGSQASPVGEELPGFGNGAPALEVGAGGVLVGLLRTHAGLALR